MNIPPIEKLRGWFSHAGGSGEYFTPIIIEGSVQVKRGKLLKSSFSTYHMQDILQGLNI